MTCTHDRSTPLQQLAQARATFQAELAGLDVTAEIYPGWTIKGVLAHFTGWEAATIRTLRAHTAGEDTAALTVPEPDSYNAQMVAVRAGLTYAQTVEEWELVREQLQKQLQALPEEKLGNPIVAPWGGTLTVAELIIGLAAHEREHAAVIRERKAALAGQSALQTNAKNRTI